LHFTFDFSPLTAFQNTAKKCFATMWPSGKKGGEQNDQKIHAEQVVESDSGLNIACNGRLRSLYGKSISCDNGLDPDGFIVHDGL